MCLHGLLGNVLLAAEIRHLCRRQNTSLPGVQMLAATRTLALFRHQLIIQLTGLPEQIRFAVRAKRAEEGVPRIGRADIGATLRLFWRHPFDEAIFRLDQCATHAIGHDCVIKSETRFGSMQRDNTVW